MQENLETETRRPAEVFSALLSRTFQKNHAPQLALMPGLQTTALKFL